MDSREARRSRMLLSLRPADLAPAPALLSARRRKIWSSNEGHCNVECPLKVDSKWLCFLNGIAPQNFRGVTEQRETESSRVRELDCAEMCPHAYSINCSTDFPFVNLFHFSYHFLDHEFSSYFSEIRATISVNSKKRHGMQPKKS